MSSHVARCLLGLLAVPVLLAGACGGDDDASTSSDSSTTSTEPDPDEGTDTSIADGSEFDPADYLAAMADYLRATSGDDTQLNENAACVAAALIEAVGVERLDAEGITAEQFAAADSIRDLGIEIGDADVDRLGEALDACIDYRQVMIATAPDGYACLVDNLDRQAVAHSFAVEFATGYPSEFTRLMFETAEPACTEQVFLAAGIAQGDLTQSQADCVADVLDDEVAHRALVAAMSEQSPAEEDRLIVDDALAQCGVER